LNLNDGENQSKFGFVTANIYQAARLNALLPRGFRIELEDSV